jgi:hypothetical protein
MMIMTYNRQVYINTYAATLTFWFIYNTELHPDVYLRGGEILTISEH